MSTRAAADSSKLLRRCPICLDTLHAPLVLYNALLCPAEYEVISCPATRTATSTTGSSLSWGGEAGMHLSVSQSEQSQPYCVSQLEQVLPSYSYHSSQV